MKDNTNLINLNKLPHLTESEMYNNYSFIKYLGGGAYGKVYKAKYKKTNEYVAIKIMDIILHEEVIIQEITNLVYLNMRDSSNNCNSNVICYYGGFTTTINNKKVICIVTEYIDGYDLLKYINENIIKSKCPPNRILLLKIMLQLMDGLNYIHKREYAHRDIKPENIMIDKNNNAKIIDFGLVCNICSGIDGTKYYMPPEILYKIKTNNISVDLFEAQKQDIWGMGVVFYLLANIGNYPFNDLQELTTNKKLNMSNYKPCEHNISQYFKQDLNKLIMSMLEINPIDRPPSDYILKVLKNIIRKYVL